MQWVSGKALDYLWTIRAGNTRVNLREFVITGFELTRDGAAVYQLVNSINTLEDMCGIKAVQYDAMRDIITKIFDLDVMRLALNSDFTGIIADEGLLDDLDIGGAGYANTLLDGIGTYNSTSLKNDLISIVDITELVFRNQIHNGETYNLALALIDYLRAIQQYPSDLNKGVTNLLSIESATQRLGSTLTECRVNGVPLVTAITNKFSQMNLFTQIVFKDSFADIYRVPLMNALDDFGLTLTKAEATINFNAVMNSLGRMAVKVIDATPVIMELINADVNQIFDILGDEEAASQIVETLAGILHELTNEDGFKVLTRSLLLLVLSDDFIGGHLGDAFGGIKIDFGRIFEPIRDHLVNFDKDIDWETELNNLKDNELKSIRDIFDVLKPALENGFNFEDFTMGEWVDFIGNLVDIIEDSPLLMSLLEPAAELVVNTVNDMLDGLEMRIEMEAGDLLDVITAMAGVMDIISGIGELDTSDNGVVLDLIESLGPFFQDISDTNISIYVPSDIFNELGSLGLGGLIGGLFKAA
jgi:hypothetical protein